MQLHRQFTGIVLPLVCDVAESTSVSQTEPKQLFFDVSLFLLTFSTFLFRRNISLEIETYATITLLDRKRWVTWNNIPRLGK